MEYLERIFEFLTDLFSSLARGFERVITSVFGSSNARYLKKLEPRVEAINAREAKCQAMTDAELKEQSDKFRKRLEAGETVEDLLVDAFAVCREAGRRVLGMRHYDVQLMGGMVLDGGAIAEMVTGEGKTLVATLPAYLNGLTGRGVHVVTVNDYLARRDAEWMGPLYMALDMTVGVIQSNMDPGERQRAYECDITYGTNNEFGFDYLRDNMRPAAKGDAHYDRSQQQVQGRLHFAIVDEVDNILIDEARTPLIISGPAHDDVSRYRKADQIARQLKRNVHFEVNEKEHSAHLTDGGVREAEKLAGVESFYTAGNMEWPHLLDNSLKAHHLYKRDVNYVVQKKEGSGAEVVIVDEFTGRLMPGRNWSDGLHQAVEAKEGVPVKEENQTLATITLQNYFKLYDKICGMTGTAMTEAGEFWKIYKLDVIAIPTNQVLQRASHPDLIYRSEGEKYAAIVEEIERLHKWDVLVMKDGEELWGTVIRQRNGEVEFQPKGTKERNTFAEGEFRSIEPRGRPILVGTVSIERSELIAAMLDKKGIKHEVLNAKHHQREAEIIAQAGRKGAVTIATNMAGRGTDIVLGGNPEAMAWSQLQEKYATRLDVPADEWSTLVNEIEQREKTTAEGREVAKMGGLHIAGTERHEARRIDLQLRGRCGRQGDPGSSRFYLSLEDDLMRIFAGEWVKNILTRLGMEEGQAIESRMVSRRIEGAQKKVEERNFEIRKNLLEYDEVMDEQRKRVYGYRQKVLDGANCKELILEMIDQETDHHIDQFLAQDYGTETFAEWAQKQFSVELDHRDFREMDFEAAESHAKDVAERMAEGQVLDLIEENMPEDVDAKEWNWSALAKAVNTRWQLGVRDHKLKQAGRDQVSELLLGMIIAAIQKIDLSDGARYLEPGFGLTTAANWVRWKFGIETDLESSAHLEPEPLKNLIRERAKATYEEKEVEFPVMAVLSESARRDATGHKRYNRDEIIKQVHERFGEELSADDLKNKQRHEVEGLLIELSRRFSETGRAVAAEVQKRVGELFDDQTGPERILASVRHDGQLRSLSDWLEENLQYDLSPEAMIGMEREELERRLGVVVEERYRAAMRRLERFLLLHHLDTAWKNHLLVMDHLRSSVGLRGYAQVDPKVEYKREGMRMFDQMWISIGQRVTDMVFKTEELPPELLASTFRETKAVHEDAPGASEIAEQQQMAIDGTEADHKPQPIRNREQRVGRNDPCPCGSGKKYKKCHGRGGGG